MVHIDVYEYSTDNIWFFGLENLTLSPVLQTNPGMLNFQHELFIECSNERIYLLENQNSRWSNIILDFPVVNSLAESVLASACPRIHQTALTFQCNDSWS